MRNRRVATYGYARVSTGTQDLTGQHMGRPPKLTPQQRNEAWRLRAEGATLKELVKSYNVGVATI